MSGPVRRILVVAPANEAQCRAMQSLLMVLRGRFAEAQIDILAADRLVDLIIAMPQVDRVISLDLPADRWLLSARYHFAQGLKSMAYDWAIVLPSSYRAALIPFFAEIPRRTGWRGPMRFFLLNDIRLLIRRHYPQRYQQYAALGFDVDDGMPPAQDLPELPATTAASGGGD